jgi:hypothetical protein
MDKGFENRMGQKLGMEHRVKQDGKTNQASSHER